MAGIDSRRGRADKFGNKQKVISKPVSCEAGFVIIFNMKTYLLAWNPKRWPWIDIGDMSDKIKIGKVVHHGWSCGNSKKPKKGDQFFLICLGQEPKGIFASGEIEGDSYEDIHWDEIKAALGETTHYVKIKYDTLFNPETDTILPRDLLNMPPLSEMHWDTQRSGVQIPDNVAKELETLWASFINSTRFSFPEEIEQTQEEIFEGAVRRVTVNAYERNPEARRKCIQHYGVTCQICSFNFKKVYGEAGKNFIHVHHLKQISKIGETYQIDPIQDLRPVCPNCHAIIHKRKPSYTIEEVKSFLKK
jgi:5-methylcytosine-specific restriction protein A